MSLTLKTKTLKIKEVEYENGSENESKVVSREEHDYMELKANISKLDSRLDSKSNSDYDRVFSNITYFE